MYWIPPVFLALSLIAAIILLNIHYHRERARLTPEQRKEEDELLRHEGTVY